MVYLKSTLVGIVIFFIATVRYIICASNGALIAGIEVRGSRAIATEAIVAKTQTKAGDKINAATIKRDISSVRSLGFAEVRAEEESRASGGKIIIFSVREKPPKPTS